MSNIIRPLRRALTTKQADAVQEDWTRTIGTNEENRAVTIERTDSTLVIVNETGDEIRFKVQPFVTAKRVCPVCEDAACETKSLACGS